MANIFWNGIFLDYMACLGYGAKFIYSMMTAAPKLSKV